MDRAWRITGYMLVAATVGAACGWLAPARGPLCLPAIALVLSGTVGFCLVARQPDELRRLAGPLPGSVAPTPERLVALAARSWMQGGPGLDREVQGAAGTGAVVSLLVMARALAVPQPALQAAALAGGLAALAYGLILAQFVAGPCLAAGRRAAERVRADDRAWVEGFLAIAGGVHPRRLADRLSVRRAARAA
ncbi:MAG: hypothetical protein HYU66_25640 [Armatimonadetes bacterium]|nr:hypothetical protein [Armatimonadota bacterium]